jgi:hypothetical protein
MPTIISRSLRPFSSDRENTDCSAPFGMDVGIGDDNSSR